MLSIFNVVNLVGMDIRFMLSQVLLLFESFVTFFAFEGSFELQKKTLFSLFSTFDNRV